MVRGFEKEQGNFLMFPWRIFPALHRLFMMALRRLSKQERESADFLMTVLVGALDITEQGQKTYDMQKQSNVSLGIIHGKK